MINRDFQFDGIELWRPVAWSDRFSPVGPLTRWMQSWNRLQRPHRTRSGRFDGRTDGVFEAKTRSFSYPEAVAEIESLGLLWRCREMAQINWLSAVPDAVREGRAPAADILLILEDTDYADPNWAMEIVDRRRTEIEAAARSGFVLVIVATDGSDADDVFINILQEIGVIHHLEMGRVWLDLRPLKEAGIGLEEVPGVSAEALCGKDPDCAAVFPHLPSVPALNIAGRWQNRISHPWSYATAERSRHPAFDLERLIHSEAGRRFAEGMRLEHRFDDAEDPALHAFLSQMGLKLEFHETRGERWVAVLPSGHRPGLPVLAVFQEVTRVNPFQTVAALSCFYEHLRLAAQGECMLVFFALETPEDNDLLAEIAAEAGRCYGADLERVYLTGHSHNGHFTMEFARRNPTVLAAAATLGNSFGMPAPAYSHEAVPVTEERLARTRLMDLPVINIAGFPENEFVHCGIDSEAFRNAADAWRRRLIGFNCPPKTLADMEAARRDGDEATRHLGFPNDGTAIEWRFGSKCWIADVNNAEGRHRLRMVAIENLPHMVAPQMAELTWEFVSRFRRDRETGRIVSC